MSWLSTRGKPRRPDPADLGRVDAASFCHLVLNQAESFARVPQVGVKVRHAGIVCPAGAGAPLRFIQEWMGRRDYKTTEIYADFAPDPSQEAGWAEAAFGSGDDGKDDEDFDDGGLGSPPETDA